MSDISLFKLEKIYIISGMTKFHKMPKLRTYVLFKHEYKTEEDYLKMFLPRSHLVFTCSNAIWNLTTWN